MAESDYHMNTMCTREHETCISLPLHFPSHVHTQCLIELHYLINDIPDYSLSSPVREGER